MEEPYSHIRPDDHNLWSTMDSEDTENEVKDFLRGFIRMTKPNLVVELGTANGHTTLAMADAMLDNDLGKLITFEVDGEKVQRFNQKLKGGDYPHADVINLFQSDVMAAGTKELFLDESIDILFIDAILEERANDWARWRNKVKPGGYGILHDTLKFEPPASEVEAIQDAKLTFRTPRGLTVIQKPL